MFNHEGHKEILHREAQSRLEKSLRKLTDFVDAKATLDTDPFWHDLSLRIEERISEVANNSRTKPRAKRTKSQDKPTLGE